MALNDRQKLFVDEYIKLGNAYLAAGTTVCRTAVVVEREIALARDSHTDCAVCKHLYLNEFARWATDILLLDFARNSGNSVERQLSRQHHHICPAGVETEGLAIRNI